jgi:hypothetical protein
LIITTDGPNKEAHRSSKNVVIDNTGATERKDVISVAGIAMAGPVEDNATSARVRIPPARKGAATLGCVEWQDAVESLPIAKGTRRIDGWSMEESMAESSIDENMKTCVSQHDIHTITVC